MKVVILGATGMVGQGVLRECLLAEDVTRVVTVGRKPSGRFDPRLQDIVVADLFNPGDALNGIEGYDACFYCLGLSAIGMTEADYTHVTLDLAMILGEPLARQSPGMTMVYVSGAGTDERSRQMWARVKGRTEAALAALPFKAVYRFRPGFIQPLHGIVSKTGWYRAIYAVTAPITPLLARLLPNAITTTERVGRAMLNVARKGAATAILDNRAINDVASRPA